MPGFSLGISTEYHEVPTDGSFCSVCGELLTPTMFKLYLSVNTGDPLTFELIPSQYNLCNPCKEKADAKGK